MAENNKKNNFVRNTEIIYTACVVKLNLENTSDKEIIKAIKEYNIEKFYCPTANFSLAGYNKQAKGHLDIPMNASYSELDLELAKTNGKVVDQSKIKELEYYRSRRDVFHKFLLNTRWIPLEIFFCEKKDSPFVEEDIKNIKFDDVKNQNASEQIIAYRVFDGLGYQAKLKWNINGHYISMELSDRLILLEHYVMDGKFTNANTTAVLQKICSDLGLKLHINGGVAFKLNLFNNGKNKNNAFTLSENSYKLLNKNIGETNYKLDNLPLDNNFLLNAKKALNVVLELAKLESAMFYVRGKDFYFGGLDKSKFQNAVYTWGRDIIDLDIDLVMPKPNKENGKYKFYIEIKSFDPVINKEIIATRGDEPPLKKKNGKAVNNTDLTDYSQKTIDARLGDVDANGVNTTKQTDENKECIFVYQRVLGYNQQQLERYADAIKYAIEHGSIQGSIQVPIDYSLTPFDTIMLKNVGKEIEQYIFNVEEVEYKFDKNGINQSIKVTTGHENIFDGQKKALKNIVSKQAIEVLGDLLDQGGTNNNTFTAKILNQILPNEQNENYDSLQN